YDFLALTFLPLLERMGPQIRTTLERPGFYPAGGGRFTVAIRPVARLGRLELLERGEITHRRARAVVADLPRHIAERELRVVAAELGWPQDCLSVEQTTAGQGPGNVLLLEVGSAALCEVFTGFGERGRPAEKVAQAVVQQCRSYLRSGAPVGEHLADQLLLPMAIAGGGAFLTVGLSRHARTHLELIPRFCDLPLTVEERGCAGTLVRLG
ncbi:MAG: RNA 3'-terminal phosphate cyclase, partial [Deltaproteobacteria bacterium]|nr:RNA 3'-terminal phosphate cyclase [Deltaproteobacteria bacterium]